MVGKQVLSRLSPSRRTKKGDNGFQRISLEVCTCKDLFPVTNSPEDAPLAGYCYPWSPSSLDLLLKNENKPSPTSSKGSISPALSLDLPDSSFSTLFSVPRRKPLPSDSASPSLPSSPENELQPSPLAIRGRTGSISPPIHLSSTCGTPGAFDWPLTLFELDSRPLSIAELKAASNRVSLASLDLPIQKNLSELSADTEIVPPPPPPPSFMPSPTYSSLPEPVARPFPPTNKPSFRHFCYRNRLMQYSPIAQNPFYWNMSQEQLSGVATC